ncbi:related to TGS1 - trimethyl guanosine synthase [Ustilago trichophora]|uniref:Trimethylguanosine synthase n=1 Tax=Ustilago trichophora TaxID=86804 RepID=A0A5C3DZQ9_9BASI|nr:related to TGS1 - trimethyl guanosine synthase [Ustilago trichophora]
MLISEVYLAVSKGRVCAGDAVWSSNRGFEGHDTCLIERFSLICQISIFNIRRRKKQQGCQSPPHQNPHADFRCTFFGSPAVTSASSSSSSSSSRVLSHRPKHLECNTASKNWLLETTMAKKRKRSSVASFVHHFDTSSAPHNVTTSSTPTHNLNLNLSAYHPDLDLSNLPSTSLSEYSSLLPQCLVHPTQFPPSMRKYWHHRFSLFSLYSCGILLDEQSWYSVTPESVAFRIAKRCASDKVVVDLFAGAGGNAIQFAMTCAGRVFAIEVDEVKVRLGRWNAKVYGVSDRITYIQGDSIELLDTIREWRDQKDKVGTEGKHEDDHVWNGIKASDLEDVEAVFLSPPWGGVDYAAQPIPTYHNTDTTSSSTSTYSLDSIQPINGITLFTRVHHAFQTPNIAYYLPRNTNLSQLSHLSTLLTPTLPDYNPDDKHTQPLPAAQEENIREYFSNTDSQHDQARHRSVKKIKIEYQYLNYGSKLSSLTAYYGSLASEWDDIIDDWRKL